MNDIGNFLQVREINRVHAKFWGNEGNIDKAIVKKGTGIKLTYILCIGGKKCTTTNKRQNINNCSE